MDSMNLKGGLNLDSKGFKQLLDSQSLVDCTLACDGGKISAHKVVLSACSTYLAKILSEHPVEHPIIILPELGIEDVRTLVYYMYTGELLKSNSSSTSSSSSSSSSHSTSLLKTAAILSVNSLNDFLTSSTISNSINNNNNSNSNTEYGALSNNNLIIPTAKNTANLISSGNGTKSDFQFKCPVCQNQFQTICSFEYHMQRIHNVTSFGCEICHKPFASLRYVLTDHMRRCHGWKAEQKLAQC